MSTIQTPETDRIFGRLTGAPDVGFVPRRTPGESPDEGFRKRRDPRREGKDLGFTRPGRRTLRVTRSR